jgi:hypothetical protein
VQVTELLIGANIFSVTSLPFHRWWIRPYRSSCSFYRWKRRTKISITKSSQFMMLITSTELFLIFSAYIRFFDLLVVVIISMNYYWNVFSKTYNLYVIRKQDLNTVKLRRNHIGSANPLTESTLRIWNIECN